MTLLIFFVFIALLSLATPPLGRYIAAIFQGEATVVHRYLGWLETASYRAAKIDATKEMTWGEYTKAMLTFNGIGFAALFFILLFQRFLPLNPQGFPGVEWTLAFNTAMSFTTNTNWQSYAGESTLSYFSQMAGLGVQNFLSAATGLAVLVALMRGITRKQMQTIGNFWADVTRSIIYLLIPLSVVFALILVSQGVVQTFSPYVEATTLEGGKQVIPLGPVASQVAIKQLGTNGGGFFNANSAHPFENPTLSTNLLEALALALIPAALTHTYGKFLGSKRHGWLLFNVMLVFLAIGFAIAIYSEYQSNPILGKGSIWEGVETRFGITRSIVWVVTTTATANGSVNAMLSSLSPLAGGVALFNILLGEVIFGGIGVGLCSMIMYVLMMVFLAGVMVGRTPEYMGKKIERREMQWVVLAILGPSALVLLGVAAAIASPKALLSIQNLGPHGFTELVYAFASSAGNNGSSFAGFNADTSFYNLLLGCVMCLGRGTVLIPSLAIAGLLAQKKMTPSSLGTLSPNTLLFALLLLGGIFIVGALTFFPVLSLGPIMEHFLMLRGKAF